MGACCDMDEHRSLVAKMRFCGLLALTCLAFAATSAGAQYPDSIVNYTKHVLDTRGEFEEWCEKGLKGVVQRRYVKDMAMTSCRWKDQYKRELVAVRMVAAGRVDSGSADCIALHYPKKLYARVDQVLREKFGAKKQTVKSGDGIVSKGWFVVLKGRTGAVSNLKTGGNGVVYGCLVELRKTED